MLDRNIKNLNKMLVKINDNMFGGSTKRPPPSMTAATPTFGYLPSSLLRPESKNISQKTLNSSGSSVTLPSPLRSASGSGLGPTAGGTSSSLTFSSKSMSMSSFPATATISPTQQQLQSAMSSATSSQGTQATTVTTALLAGRTKLLRHRHQQQHQQQQFHHHHHHHHYTPQLRFRLLPGLKATSFFTILTLVCLETVLLSTVSNCAKTFYMHWNTSNSIFRIDNTDHIIDVNKGNLAFEFDQVHIICPVYEPGTFENETEKYIIYNVSKVEYETCRITNADPRVIAICDKPQKLMFFTITFRPFTPQPGGLEFLPGNDYYFISTSSKGDLYRRIGGRCSTNNMKVVFKVCCAPEDKNNRTNNNINGSGIGNGGNSGGGGGNSGGGGGNSNTAIQQQQHNNNININGGNIGGGTGLLPSPKLPGMGGGIGGGGGGGIGGNGGGLGGGMNGMNNGVIGGGGGLMLNGNSGTSINTNIDQFNRIPMQQPNNIGGMGGIGGGGGGNMGMNGIGGNGGMGQHQTGIRINNVPSSQQHPSQKNGMHGGFISPMANINTNSSNVVQSTISWPDWGNHKNNNYNNHMGEHHHRANINGKHDDNDDDDGSDDSDRDTDVQHSTPVSTIGIHPHFYPSYILTSPRPSNLNNTRNLSPSHKPTKKTNDYDKHPNEVVKNEELTYNSAASSLSFFKMTRRRTSSQSLQVLRALRYNNHSRSTSYKSIYQKLKSSLLELLVYTTSNHRNPCNPIADILNFIFNCNPIIITTTVLVALTNLFQYKIMTSWNEDGARSDTLHVNKHNTNGRITRCQSRVLVRTRSFVKSLSSFRRRQDEEREGDLPPSSSAASFRDRSSAEDCIQDSSSSTTKNNFSNTITR